MIKTIVVALVVLAGLAIVPALTDQTVDAGCKPKKPKDNVDAVMPEPSFTLVKKGCGDGGGGINVKCDGFKNNGDPCKRKRGGDI